MPEKYKTLTFPVLVEQSRARKSLLTFRRSYIFANEKYKLDISSRQNARL